MKKINIYTNNIIIATNNNMTENNIFNVIYNHDDHFQGL